MRFERVVLTFVICASATVTALMSQSQSHDPGSVLQAVRSGSEIAQELAGQDQFILLPAKGRVKHSVKMDAKAFELPTGESRVLLFRLPDYGAPYTLTIMSPCNHGCLGFSKSIFVPSGMFLDAGFRITFELPAERFEELEAGWTKPYRLEATVLIDEPQKDDRYLLLYTVGEGVGAVLRSGRYGKTTASADGSVELTVRPANRNASEAEAGRANDVRAIWEAEKGEVEEKRAPPETQAIAISDQARPLEPGVTYPVSALAAFIRSPRFQSFDVWYSEGGEHWLFTVARNPRLRGSGSDSYQFQAGRYNIVVLTPVLEWYLDEWDTIQKIKGEAKQRKRAGGAFDVDQLDWDLSKYEGKIQSVVRVVAIPDFRQTTLSWMLSGVLKEVTQLKYKTSFSRMCLLCDGEEVQPIDCDRFQVGLPGGYGTPEGAYAQAGAYAYSFETFDQSKCRKLELRIVSESGSGTDARAVPGRILRQVWADFEGYRNAVREQ